MIMATDFSKVWEDYSKGVGNPLSELIDLNVKAFNKSLARSSKFMNELMKIKKPEEAMDMQARFLSESNAEAMGYFQESAEALVKCCSTAHSQFTDAATKASKAYQQTAQNFKMNGTPSPKAAK